MNVLRRMQMEATCRGEWKRRFSGRVGLDRNAPSKSKKKKKNPRKKKNQN
jgi:hypothetical protein